MWSWLLQVHTHTPLTSLLYFQPHSSTAIPLAQHQRESYLHGRSELREIRSQRSADGKLPAVADTLQCALPCPAEVGVPATNNMTFMSSTIHFLFTRLVHSPTQQMTDFSMLANVYKNKHTVGKKQMICESFHQENNNTGSVKLTHKGVH